MLTREERTCEVRMDDVSEPGKVYLAGRATSFNTRSSNLGTARDRWYEEIMPGAFDAALGSGENVAHLVNHSSDRFLGDTQSGTTRLSADRTALRFKTLLATETAEARAVIAHFKRGEIRSASFAFSVDPSSNPDVQEWKDIIDDDGSPATLRIIHKVAALFDVSTLLGARPAYPEGTSAMLSDRALPPGMPVELRARLEQRAAPNPDPVDDDDDSPPECECACDRCLENRCEECEGEGEDKLCEDEACRAAGCPMQDDPTDDDDDIEDLLDELEDDRSAPELEDELTMVDLELEEAMLGW